jgi:hypothetical protein
MYCRNCGEEIGDDTDFDDDEAQNDEFCSHECRDDYMDKVGFLLLLTSGG